VSAEVESHEAQAPPLAPHDAKLGVTHWLAVSMQPLQPAVHCPATQWSAPAVVHAAL